MHANRNLALVTGAMVLAVAWSGIAPRERHTWWLEVAPILLVLPLLWLTRRRFPLTPLLYGLIAFHAAVLAYGGHTTYEHTPLGNWARDALGLARNPYDRFGHLVQGFVPAIAAREILLRTSPIRRGGWLVFLVGSVCLAISALYELVEFAAAKIAGGAADAFLGTQGDIWDSHWDMLSALLGCALALLLLPGRHDRQLSTLGSPSVRTVSAAVETAGE